jgi:hypothetical protein
VAAPALAVAAALTALACAPSYELHRKTRRKYPRVAPAGDVRCYVEPVPDRGFTVLATVDSDSVTTVTAVSRERMLEALRRGASRAGAEALFAVEVVTRQTHGMVRDPYAPALLPTPTQGWADTYFMRGVAVVSDARLSPKLARYRERPREVAPLEDRAEKAIDPLAAPPSPYADPARAIPAPTWNDVLAR